MTQFFQHLDHQRRKPSGSDAKRLPPHPARVGERAEHVENRSHPELAAGRTGVPHRRMEGWRKTEAHAGRVDARADRIRPQRDVDAERLEHVGAAAAARRGAVPMLCHRDAGPSSDQRGSRRDVERPSTIATGPAGIDRSLGNVERGGVGPHGIDKPGHLLSGFPLCSQCDQQPGDLDRGRFSCHDAIHHATCLVAGQGTAPKKMLDRLGRRHQRGYW